jgi:hypothetical protein
MASQAAPLGIAAIMGGGMLGGGGGNSGGGGTNITNNYYGGGGGGKPSMLNRAPGVHSMNSPVVANAGPSSSTPKTGSFKLAKLLLDPLLAASERRVANDVLNKLAPPEQPKPAQAPSSEAEVELVSKHPEIAKLLEDEQNKAYLEKLISSR